MLKGKTFVSLLALAVSVTLLLAACTQKGQNTETAQPASASASASQQPAATEAPPEEPIEISWLSWYAPETDDSPVQQYLEEKFNVKITNVRVERDQWQQQLNVKLAAKEIPDVFWLWGSEEIEVYSKQGVLAELPQALIKEKMPKYAQDVDRGDPNLWNYALIAGKSYGIPLYWPDGATPMLPGYNGDWLKAIGYTEAPKTLAEFEDVLYKFRNNDPDGNGKKDTYGMTARAKDALVQAFNVVLNAYGIVPPYANVFTKDSSGNITFPLITEEARQALKLLNKWYKDGVIDPEFITTDYAKMRSDFATGRVGVIDPGLWYGHQNTLEPDFKAVNPDGEYVIGKPLIGPSGQPGKGFSFSLKNSYVGMGIQVASDPQKRDKIFEILEALATDDETYLMASYGREGTDYHLDEDAVVPIPEYADMQKRGIAIGAGPFYSFFMTKSLPMIKYDLPPVKLAYKQRTTEGVPAFTSEVLSNIPELTQYPDLAKLNNEYYLKFILGEVDLDQGFDDFVALWKQSGGQAVLDSAQNIAASMK